MITSREGLEFIKSNEGLRLRAYDDGGGVITIGYGHVGGVGENAFITEDTAQELLLEDTAHAELAVNRLVRVQLSQNQFDALVDFVFNVGGGNFATSTLLRLVNLEMFEEAADQFLRWDKQRIDGKLIPVLGLHRRRELERDLFLKEVTASPTA